jgi:hypothetical protein
VRDSRANTGCHRDGREGLREDQIILLIDKGGDVADADGKDHFDSF